MRVRRVLLDRFDSRAAQPGEPLAVLNRRFAHVYLHHRYALDGATKAIGGMRFTYAIAGESSTPVTIVPAAEQRRALSAVLSTLTPAELRIPARIAALIPPVPFGFDGDLTLIPTPAGSAFDPIAPAHSLAQEIVDNLLHPERAARLATFNAQDRANPGLGEVLTALVAATWGAPLRAAADPQDAALRRVAQRAALDGLLDLAGSPRATLEVRSTTEQHLQTLRRQIAANHAGSTGADAALRVAARRDIDRYFEGEDDVAARPRPAAILLPWP